MDFINDIEQHKYAVLDDLYTLFPPSTFLQDYVHEDSLLRMKLGKFRRDLDDYNNDRVFTWNKKGKTHSHNEPSAISGQRDPFLPSHVPMDLPLPSSSHPPSQPDPPRPLMSLSIGSPTQYHNWKPNKAPCHFDPPFQTKKQLNSNSTTTPKKNPPEQPI